MRIFIFLSIILAILGIISGIIIKNESTIKKIIYNKNINLENILAGSWLIASHTYTPFRECHQYNFTHINEQFILEENWNKNGKIYQDFWDIQATGNNTFQLISPDFTKNNPNITLEIIFKTWDHDIVILHNHFNKHTFILSPRPFFEDWEYIMIDIACQLNNKNCKNLFSSFNYKKC